MNATAANKVYDGTTTASATLTDNRVAGDSLSISFVAADFSNKAVGDGKTVAVSGIAVTGPDAGNYAFNTTASAPANITAATVAGSITANNKIYDGSVAATIASRSLSGALGGDSVSLAGGAACFADPYVGNNKPVTATGLGLTGTDSGNYTLASSTATTTANIVGAQAPNITRLTISPDRWVHLLCTGSPGQTYVVQATANLNHPTWVVLSTNVISTNGTLSVLDSTATNYPARFYRAAVPQP